MSDYSVFAQANPGTDYPVKDAALRAQLSLDSDKIDSGGPGHAFGCKRNATAALNFGYYGGCLWNAGALTVIADGVVALTNGATNYVEVTRAGVVSANVVGFTAGRIRLYTVVTAAGAITVITDKRARLLAGGEIDDMPIGQNTPAAVSATTLSALGLFDLSAAGAGQIKFPAAQNASADANTLDDYEEGVWTPTLMASGGGQNLTYNQRGGTYVKIGRKVWVWFYANVTVVAAGTGLRGINPSSLPFAPRSDARTTSTGTRGGVCTMNSGNTGTPVITLNDDNPSAATAAYLVNTNNSSVDNGFVNGTYAGFLTYESN